MNKNSSRTKLETLFPILLVLAISLQLIIGTLTYIRLSGLSRNVLQIAALYGSRGSYPIQQGLPPGTRAPEFTLIKTRGKAVSLKDFIGQKILLMFSSPTCPSCIQLYADLKLLQEQNPDIQIVMISEGSIEENKKLASEQGFSFPVLSWQDSVAIDYRVTGTPSFYVIDEQGIIVRSGWVTDLRGLKKLLETPGLNQ